MCVPSFRHRVPTTRHPQPASLPIHAPSLAEGAPSPQGRLPTRYYRHIRQAGITRKAEKHCRGWKAITARSAGVSCRCAIGPTTSIALCVSVYCKMIDRTRIRYRVLRVPATICPTRGGVVRHRVGPVATQVHPVEHAHAIASDCQVSKRASRRPEPTELLAPHGGVAIGRIRPGGRAGRRPHLARLLQEWKEGLGGLVDGKNS